MAGLVYNLVILKPIEEEKEGKREFQVVSK